MTDSMKEESVAALLKGIDRYVNVLFCYFLSILYFYNDNLIVLKVFVMNQIKLCILFCCLYLYFFVIAIGL